MRYRKKKRSSLESILIIIPITLFISSIIMFLTSSSYPVPESPSSFERETFNTIIFSVIIIIVIFILGIFSYMATKYIYAKKEIDSNNKKEIIIINTKKIKLCPQCETVITSENFCPCCGNSINPSELKNGCLYKSSCKYCDHLKSGERISYYCIDGYDDKYIGICPRNYDCETCTSWKYGKNEYKYCDLGFELK